MVDTEYIKNDKGQIVKVKKGDKQADIVWSNNANIDIDYVNIVLTILFTGRGIGG